VTDVTVTRRQTERGQEPSPWKHLKNLRLKKMNARGKIKIGKRCPLKAGFRNPEVAAELSRFREFSRAKVWPRGASCERAGIRRLSRLRSAPISTGKCICPQIDGRLRLTAAARGIAAEKRGSKTPKFLGPFCRAAAWPLCKT
jgi:hypothetical protein